MESRTDRQKDGQKDPPSPTATVVILKSIHHLILFYICTKHHQNILQGIRVTEQRQEIKFKHKKGREHQM